MRGAIILCLVVCVLGAQAKRSANRKFYDCCREKPKINGKCYKACKYDLTQAELTDLFLGHTCPYSALGQYMYCFGSGSSQMRCCLRSGVHRTAAKTKCLQFCDLRPGKKLLLDVSMLPCWEKMNDIIQCFEKHKDSLDV